MGRRRDTVLVLAGGGAAGNTLSSRKNTNTWGETQHAGVGMGTSFPPPGEPNIPSTCTPRRSRSPPRLITDVLRENLPTEDDTLRQHIPHVLKQAPRLWRPSATPNNTRIPVPPSFEPKLLQTRPRSAGPSLPLATASPPHRVIVFTLAPLLGKCTTDRHRPPVMHMPRVLALHVVIGGVPDSWMCASSSSKGTNGWIYVALVLSVCIYEYLARRDTCETSPESAVRKGPW